MRTKLILGLTTAALAVSTAAHAQGVSTDFATAQFSDAPSAVTEAVIPAASQNHENEFSADAFVSAYQMVSEFVPSSSLSTTALAPSYDALEAQSLADSALPIRKLSKVASSGLTVRVANKDGSSLDSVNWSSQGGWVSVSQSGVQQASATSVAASSFSAFSSESSQEVATYKPSAENPIGAPVGNAALAHTPLLGTPMPEPSTWALMVIGALGAGVNAISKRKRAA